MKRRVPTYTIKDNVDSRDIQVAPQLPGPRSTSPMNAIMKLSRLRYERSLLCALEKITSITFPTIRRSLLTALVDMGFTDCNLHAQIVPLTEQCMSPTPSRVLFGPMTRVGFFALPQKLTQVHDLFSLGKQSPQRLIIARIHGSTTVISSMCTEPPSCVHTHAETPSIIPRQRVVSFQCSSPE